MNWGAIFFDNQIFLDDILSKLCYRNQKTKLEIKMIYPIEITHFAYAAQIAAAAAAGRLVVLVGGHAC